MFVLFYLQGSETRVITAVQKNEEDLSSLATKVQTNNNSVVAELREVKAELRSIRSTLSVIASLVADKKFQNDELRGQDPSGPMDDAGAALPPSESQPGPPTDALAAPKLPEGAGAGAADVDIDGDDYNSGAVMMPHKPKGECAKEPLDAFLDSLIKETEKNEPLVTPMKPKPSGMNLRRASSSGGKRS